MLEAGDASIYTSDDIALQQQRINSTENNE